MVMVKYYKHLSLIHKYFHDSFVKAVIVTLQTFPGLSLRWSGPLTDSTGFLNTAPHTLVSQSITD